MTIAFVGLGEGESSEPPLTALPIKSSKAFHSESDSDCCEFQGTSRSTTWPADKISLMSSGVVPPGANETPNAKGDGDDVTYDGSLLMPRSARCVGAMIAVIGTLED